MGTTESLLSYNNDDGDDQDHGDLRTTQARPPDVGRPRHPSSKLVVPRRGVAPGPTSSSVSVRSLKERRIPPSASPAKRKAAAVVSCRLTGLVLGMDGAGKKTLLQRLQGKDPFFVEDRQAADAGPTTREEGEGGLEADVPYQTSYPVLHDRITLAVRTANRIYPAGTINDNGSKGGNASDEGAVPTAAALAAGLAAVDFAVLLIHPKSDPHIAESYVKETVQQFLRLQGYMPNDESEPPLSPSSDASQRNDGSSHAAAPAPLASPPPPRPVCLCLLLNFRDLKPSKHDKRKAKKKSQQQQCAAAEPEPESAPSSAPNPGSSWLSQSTVQQWVLEVLQLHDRNLDPSQMVLKLGPTSLYNCYGLGMLHSFVYQSYLCRQQYDARCRLQLVQNLLHNASTQPDDAESTSYEAFVESSSRHRREIESSKQQEATPAPSGEPSRQQQPPPNESARRPETSRRAVVNAHGKNHVGEAAAATSVPAPPQESTSVAKPGGDAMEASRAALEAFLMDDDDSDENGSDRETDQRSASRRAASKATSSEAAKRTKQVGRVDKNENCNGDSDDDDDFFVEHLPAASRHPPLAREDPITTDTALHGDIEQSADGGSGVSGSNAIRAATSRDDGGENEDRQPSGNSYQRPSELAKECEDDGTTKPASAPSSSQAVTEHDASDATSGVRVDQTTHVNENENVNDRTSSDAADANGSPKTTIDTADEHNADADAADASRGVDRGVTNGSTAPSLRANGNRVEVSDTTTPADLSKPHALSEAENIDEDDDDDDDDAFVIQDTVVRYPTNRTLQAYVPGRSSANRNQSVEATPALSAAALAAIAEARHQAELMLLGSDSPATTDIRKTKQKKEKKQKKGKKKDSQHD